MKQEEKEKAYDEAIQNANNILEGKCKNFFVYNHYNQGLIEYIFPELAESDDEKIRRELIRFVKGCFPDDTSEQRKSYLAWLEKQNSNVDNANKEYWRGYREGKQEILDKYAELEKQGQKPQGKSALEAAKEEKVNNQNCVNPADESKVKPKFKTGDRVIGIVSGMQYFITEVCDDHYYTESGCIIMFCSQDNFELYEQKLADKVELGKKFTPIESALKDLICDVDNCYTIEQVRRLLFEHGYKDKILNAAKEEMQKSDWSEEDEKIALSIEQVMNCASLLNMVPEKENKIRTWLKSIKERVQPQSKQEWSEEDENNILFLTSIIEECFKDKEKITLYSDTACADFTEKNVIDRLKSLRPQNRWKPSDEQMDVLLSEVTAWTKGCPKQIVLESLYNDLKNLK